MSGKPAVAIVGSRDFPNLEAVRSLVRKLSAGNVVVISGGAQGVDSTAEHEAKELGIEVRSIRPDYKAHHPKLAPKIRNREIAQACDVLIAFWDGDSGGTANAIAWAAFYDKDIVVLLPEGAVPAEGVSRTADDWPAGEQPLVTSIATAEKVNEGIPRAGIPYATKDDAIDEEDERAIDEEHERFEDEEPF